MVPRTAASSGRAIERRNLLTRRTRSSTRTAASAAPIATSDKESQAPGARVQVGPGACSLELGSRRSVLANTLLGERQNRGRGLLGHEVRAAQDGLPATRHQ